MLAPEGSARQSCLAVLTGVECSEFRGDVENREHAKDYLLPYLLC